MASSRRSKPGATGLPGLLAGILVLLGAPEPGVVAAAPAAAAALQDAGLPEPAPPEEDEKPAEPGPTPVPPAGPPEPPPTERPPLKFEEVPGEEPEPAPAAPPEPQPEEERTGFWGAIGDAADWFLEKEDGRHEREWGIVPLIVLSPDAGFGGGLKAVHRNVLGTPIVGEALGEALEQVKIRPPRISGDLQATYASGNFFEAEAVVRGERFFGLVEWVPTIRYRNRPTLRFYGIGNDTREDDAASIALEDTRLVLALGVEPIPEFLTVLWIFQFQNVNAGEGDEIEHVDEFEESRFADDPPVGFGPDDNELTNALGGSIIIDTRDNRFNPSIGAKLEFTCLAYGPWLGDNGFRYNRYIFDISAHAPLVGKNLIFGVRGRLESVDSSLRRIPFYELPQLGGTTTLRGYYEGRLRDRHSVLVNAELRFPIWRMIHGGLFIDLGRVANRIEDFRAEDLYPDGGLGIRFVVHPDILVRLDAAISREAGVLVSLEFGHIF